jgi:hypothetical protein
MRSIHSFTCLWCRSPSFRVYGLREAWPGAANIGNVLFIENDEDNVEEAADGKGSLPRAPLTLKCSTTATAFATVPGTA